MNQAAMTSTEFFGVFLSFVLVLSAIAYMKIGYESAKHSHFRQMLIYLRLAGGLAVGSWIVMFAVMFKCERVCWVQREPIPVEKMTPLAIPIAMESHYTALTAGGVKLNWRRENGRLLGTVGSGRLHCCDGGCDCGGSGYSDCDCSCIAAATAAGGPAAGGCCGGSTSL